MVTDLKTYEVTGVLTPDATGIYEDAGEFNGKRYYRREDGAWFLFWDGITGWNIDRLPNGPSANYWIRIDPSIEGEYDPLLGADGIATVTEI